MEVIERGRLLPGMYIQLVPGGRKEGESKKTDAYIVNVYRHSVLVEFHFESGARERQMYTNFDLYEAGIYTEADLVGLSPTDTRWVN